MGDKKSWQTAVAARPLADQVCATGCAGASFRDRETVITIFRWLALAEPVAHGRQSRQTLVVRQG